MNNAQGRSLANFLMKLEMPRVPTAIGELQYHFPHIPIHKGTVFPSLTTD